MSLVQKRYYRIDHSQAGANQPGRRVCADAGKRAGRPRIEAVQAAVEKSRFGSWRRLRREIADGEHRRIGGEPAIAIQRERQPSHGPRQAAHIAAQQFQAVVVLGGLTSSRGKQ